MIFLCNKLIDDNLNMKYFHNIKNTKMLVQNHKIENVSLWL